MSDYTIHTANTAPEPARSMLADARQRFGFVPNLLGIMAEAPATLEAYLSLGDLLAQTSFTPVEQQVIALSVSLHNECDYCMAAHSGLAKMAGISEADLEALRAGRQMADAKLEALAQFTQSVVRDRGHVAEDAVTEFLTAGFTQAHILEVLVGVAMKTISNYTNHLADTPLDEQFQPLAWTAPVRLDRAV